MARLRRNFSAFNLSFLDIMSCGFGAVVLLFLIMKHSADASRTDTGIRPDLSSEVSLLEEEILEGEEGLAKLRNSLAELDERLAIAQGMASRVSDSIKDTSGAIEEVSEGTPSDKIEQLKEALKQLDQEQQKLAAENKASGNDTRSFAGEGNREYLTGLKLGGQRILVLLDASASMLDKTIVNIIRRRNMSDERKRSAEKWQQAVKTVDWLSAKFPQGSQYQIYTFNTDTQALLEQTRGQWLNVSDREQLNQVIENLGELLPAGGTNLEQLFGEVGRLRPLPDNIYLITDGLPTQGSRPPRATTISGRDRVGLFEDALKRLPANIPINVILSPMEGDPMAASEFWKLAIVTNGSFMSPAEDWP
ncbi:MAG: hypothetical protein HW386_525 [Gammaproteobacteria bacterium]|nr:hypothetical protein [Gammaproteobacteria bacterium]